MIFKSCAGNLELVKKNSIWLGNAFAYHSLEKIWILIGKYSFEYQPTMN